MSQEHIKKFYHAIIYRCDEYHKKSKDKSLPVAMQYYYKGAAAEAQRVAKVLFSLLKDDGVIEEEETTLLSIQQDKELY
ncbi:hypothetical protein GCM10027051_31550 [Niabella terrae]